jgi:hypothetical protein
MLIAEEGRMMMNTPKRRRRRVAFSFNLFK